MSKKTESIITKLGQIKNVLNDEETYKQFVSMNIGRENDSKEFFSGVKTLVNKYPDHIIFEIHGRKLKYFNTFGNFKYSYDGKKLEISTKVGL